jgi:hypothetical protein
MDKDTSRNARVQIQRILMADWDPIGVSDEPLAATEYDLYIGDVYDLLMRSASHREIVTFLRWVEIERMGMCEGQGEPLMPAPRRDGAVSSLLAIKIKSE